MRGSDASGKKPIKEVEKLRAQKPKLECVSSKTTEHTKAASELVSLWADKGAMLRKTGIDILDDIAWGMHLCVFYHSKQDLIDILVPYFKAGLEDNEFCMWITSEPLNAQEAKKSLKRAVKNLDSYIRKGQIEILDYGEWYTKSGKFEADRVLQGWIQKYDDAIKRGFDGLRLTGNTSWLEKKDWIEFIDHEESVNNIIGKYKMLAICTYSLDKCEAGEVINVIDNHQFAIVKREGIWKILESAEQRKIEQAMRDSEKKYHSLFMNMLDGFAYCKIIVDESNKPVDFVYLEINDAFEKLTTLKRKDVIGKKATEAIPGIRNAHPELFDIYGKVALTGKGANFDIYFEPLKIWLSISVYSPQKEYFVAVFENITERKKAEQLLQKERDKAQRYLDVAGVMLVAIDAEQRVGLLNKKGCEILGYKEEEIIARNWFDNFLPEKVREQVREVFKKVIQSEADAPEYYENPVLTKNGDERLIAWRNTVLRNEKGNVIATLSSGEDITERRKAEEALQASEQRYRELFENAGEGIITLDLDGRLTEANRLVEEYGFDRAELLGRKLFDFVPDYDKARSVSDFQALVAGRRVQGQMDVITPKGIRTVEYRDTPIVRAGEVVGVQAILTDITERKKVEEALRMSEEKFKSIFEHANDGVIYLDTSGNILDINEKAVQMFGGPKQQAVNKHFTEVGIFSADEIPTLMSNFEKIFAGEEVVLTVPIKNKKGREIILECSASLAKTDDGTGRIMVTARDITERIKASEQIEKLAKFPAEDPNPVLRISGYGTVIYGNKASATLLKTLDCRVGHSLPDRWQGLVLDALSSGQSQQTEVQCGDRTFSLTLAPVVDANYVNVYGHDITERKKAEQELARALAWQEEIFEGARDAVFISDADSKFVTVNSSACKLTGYSREELLGMQIPDLHEEQDLTAYRLFHDRIMAGEEIVSEAKILRKDGIKVDTEFNNRRITISGTTYMHTAARNITERKKAEEELIKNQAKLKAMASKILMTEERERQHLAVGLHDEVCQKLVLTKLALESSMNLVSDSSVLASLKIAAAGIGETIEKADSLTFELSNPVLRQLGFVAALERYLNEEIQKKHGIVYELRSYEHLSKLPEEIKNCLYRVTRELLTNVVKHAHARKVKVSIHESRGRIYVGVQDDGVGFKESQAGSTVSKTARFGLFSVREQLEYLGGHLEIESEPGRGTAATIVVPLTKKAIV